MSKETLGYPSRTAAVLALAAEGLDNREIGQRIGITPSTVAALAASSARWNGRKVRKDAKYGLSTAQLETAIMDLFDQGLTRDDIAKRLNLRPESAEKIIGYMRIGASDRRSGPEAAALGSASLIAAIRRHHPERCGQ